jgi:hypothetical protein
MWARSGALGWRVLLCAGRRTGRNIGRQNDQEVETAKRLRSETKSVHLRRIPLYVVRWHDSALAFRVIKKKGGGGVPGKVPSSQLHLQLMLNKCTPYKFIGVACWCM